MDVKWQLPAGFSVGPLRYPVPTRLTVAGPHELRLRARLCRARAAEGAGGCAGHRADPRRCALARLHRQDLRARAGRSLSLDLPIGSGTAEPRAVRRMAAGSCRGRWRPPAISSSLATSCASRSRFRRASTPASLTCFPIDRRRRRLRGAAGLPARRRLARRRASSAKALLREQFPGVLAFGGGRGLRVPGRAGAVSRRRHRRSAASARKRCCGRCSARSPAASCST